MNADIALQLMLLSFGTFGISHWLSQKEWGTPFRTRMFMFLAFGLFMIGAVSGFVSFLGIVLVAYSKWAWPWYAGFIAGGSYVYGMAMIQFGAMRGLINWSDRRTTKVIRQD